jgi:hypothetical protein
MVRKAGKLRLPDREEYDPDPGRDPTPESSWDDVDDRLAGERNYWLVTTRADGRPHAIAVWAVWVDGALWLTSSPDTVSAKNLARDPRAIVHLESGATPAVLEGTVERPAPEGVPAAVIDAYEAKYGWRMDPADEGMPFHAFRPSVARAWSADDVRGSGVRWTFDA